tara:strand:- start:1103 stop:1324 length:222 start_codon:yes stop_codon:yes gene_type:complete
MDITTYKKLYMNIIHCVAAVFCMAFLILSILEFAAGELVGSAISLAFGCLMAIWAAVKSWQLDRELYGVGHND